MTSEPDKPRVRALALGAVALAVTAAGAVGGPARVPVLLAVAVVLGGLGAWRWRRAGRTGLGTSAVVTAVLVALLLVEHLTDDVDLVLALTSATALATGVGLRERRLAVSGVVTLAVLLGRPVEGGATFTHCLVATDVAIPLPRLDGPLVLAVVALGVGTALRWTGRGRHLGMTPVARGIEVTGAVGLVALLAVKAMELPAHRLLCGVGTPVDPGWVLVGVAFGAAAGLYGLAAHDVVWEGVGLGSITLQGLLATTLTGQVWWALGCALVLVGALAVAEWLRVPWPDEPSYEVARPSLGDLLGRRGDVADRAARAHSHGARSAPPAPDDPEDRR